MTRKEFLGLALFLGFIPFDKLKKKKPIKIKEPTGLTTVKGYKKASVIVGSDEWYKYIGKIGEQMGADMRDDVITTLLEAK